MVEKMGFKKNRRITLSMNNTRVTATVGGQRYHFRSKFEYHWAQYLQILTDNQQIQGWSYESETYYFEGEKTAPVMYRPDFLVVENDGSEVWHETKGYHDGKTNKKLQRMAKHYPDVVIELVLQHIPKKGIKGANRRQVAERYCRRVYDGSVVLRQCKGLIKDMPYGEE